MKGLNQLTRELFDIVDEARHALRKDMLLSSASTNSTCNPSSKATD